jgi:CBS domain containing-hemolysin-like protein
MVPRTAVHALPITATLEETKNAFRTLGYSRLPVFSATLDNIVGVVYRRDMEPYFEAGGEGEFSLEGLLHKPVFVTATAKLGAALKRLQEERIHLAFVVDEHGGLEGIVTLEDLLEEIVGEIYDEFDEESRSQIQLHDGFYVLDGMLAVRDLNRKLRLQLPEDGSYTTLAGFLLAIAGRLLHEGETVEFSGVRFTIERTERRRIRRVRMTPIAEGGAVGAAVLSLFVGACIAQSIIDTWAV